MQKSPVFCVARAGSWRLELFLFGHLAPPPPIVFRIDKFSVHLTWQGYYRFLNDIVVIVELFLIAYLSPETLALSFDVRLHLTLRDFAAFQLLNCQTFLYRD